MDAGYPTGERAPRRGERVVVGTWRPLGSGDRLYVEAAGHVPSDVIDRLENLALTMRDLCRPHEVRRIDITPGTLASGQGRPRARRET